MQDTQTTVDQDRRLPWEGCLNARDLGGYTTIDGRTTRSGVIVRSDNLALLTPAGRQALVAYGIHTVIDLRFPQELTEFPNPFADSALGVNYVHISLIEPSAIEGDSGTLAAGYCTWIDQYAHTISRTISTIARVEDGGVLIHCMGGKDRTGVTAALILAIVGVPAETIAADYALTAEYLRPRDEDFLANGPGTREEREAILTRFSPRADVMLEVLDYLDRHYGGAEAYLLASGVSAEDLSRLRQRLLS